MDIEAEIVAIKDALENMDDRIKDLQDRLNDIEDRLRDVNERLLETARVPVKIKTKRMPEDHVPKPFHGNPVP